MRGDLRRRLAQAEDDFGEALADGAMMIDAREAEILERLRAQRVERAGSRARVGRVELASVRT